MRIEVGILLYLILMVILCIWCYLSTVDFNVLLFLVYVNLLAISLANFFDDWFFHLLLQTS